MKRGYIIVLVLLMLISLSVSALAVTENDGRILDEIELQIHDECSGHPSFIHYLVREDGWFAVYYRTSDKSNSNDGIFKLAYVDVFNAEGQFLREIVFESRDDIVLNFTEDVLEIYLTEWMLSVDLDTWETVASQTSRYFAQNSDIRSRFNQQIQEANGWRYSCKGTSMNYTSLVTEKGEVKQVLLSLSGNVPGTGRSAMSFVVGGAVSGLVIILLCLHCIRKCKHNA